MNTPFPSYYALPMLSKLGTGGDTMVAAGTDTQLVTAHAVRNANGDLSVMLINKDPSSSYQVNPSYAGFTPSAATPVVYGYGDEASSVTSAAQGTSAVQTLPRIPCRAPRRHHAPLPRTTQKQSRAPCLVGPPITGPTRHGHGPPPRGPGLARSLSRMCRPPGDIVLFACARATRDRRLRAPAAHDRGHNAGHAEAHRKPRLRLRDCQCGAQGHGGGALVVRVTRILRVRADVDTGQRAAASTERGT